MAGHETLSKLTWLGSDRPLARSVGRPIQRFMAIEAASGILLIIATVVALGWANSPWKDSYHDLWNTEVRIEVGDVIALEEHGDHSEPEAGAEGSAGTEGSEGTGGEAAAEAGEDDGGHPLSLGLFVNDALMVLFFFVVGLEIKRELVVGELRNPRAAMLPALAALGGMVVPALLYTVFNAGTDTSGGWGIPMATDIAFAVGVMSLLGPRVPGGLKIFLLTLAIVDDIGAIIVIALFYTDQLATDWLLAAAVLVGVVTLMKRAKVWFVPAYVAVGIVLWYALFQSGVHATIAGVLLGLLAPARPLVPEVNANQAFEPTVFGVRRTTFHLNESISIAERLANALHPYTSFLIIPIFALANAGVELSSDTISDAVTAAPTLGVFFGLLVGKAVGITLFTMGAVKLGVAPLPSGAGARHILAVGTLGGIGFTVALFVTGLSFDDPDVTDQAKMGILAASLLASVLGLWLLSMATKRRDGQGDEPANEEPALIGVG